MQNNNKIDFIDAISRLDAMKKLNMSANFFNEFITINNLSVMKFKSKLYYSISEINKAFNKLKIVKQAS